LISCKPGRDNKLVVNEFESIIDASFVPNFGRSFPSLEYQVKSFVETFWRDQFFSFEIIRKCIAKTELGHQVEQALIN
jgi:hypothetical protein